MVYVRYALISILIGSVLISGCGKKKEAVKEEGEAKKKAVQQEELASEEIPFKTVIEGAGFHVTDFKTFPAQEQMVKGRLLVYEAKNSGGIIFIKKQGSILSPAWHWYFADFAVDSATAVEINEDGLWDLRVIDKKKHRHVFIQDESFTLTARPRDDMLALNAASEAGATPGHELWMCFDGDTVTSWQTKIAGTKEAAVNLIAPFGVQEGILTVGTSTAGTPKRCDVLADGAKIDRLEIKNTAGRQLFRLPESIKGAREVRIVFTGTYDGDGLLEVTELGLK